MPLSAEILAIVRWTDLNEYEGSLTLQIAGIQLTCYIMMNASEWDGLRVGGMLEGELSLLALSNAEQGQPTPQFRQLDGVNYAVSGRLMIRDDELLTLQVGELILQADLDGNACAVAEGEWIRLEGQLGFELI